MNYGRTSLRRRAKQLDARGTRIRHKIGVILGKLLLIGIIVGGCATVSFGVGAFKGILASAPDISEVDVIPTGYSTKVLAADGSETAKLVAAGSNRQYVTIDQIPENLQHAVVAIEDERFYDHNGIDLKGIVRALVADVRTRDFSQGASTLTQQLIKNNVLSEQWANENDSNISKMEKMERQVQRKIQEQYLAIELEKKVNDKNWILENYLNSINLGSNTLGVQAAAQRYFGKDVSKLTLSECAVIAGITKNPAGYNPILHPKENAKRRKNVLDAMKKQGYISQKQYDKAMADDVYGRISEHNDVREETMNTYFVDAVIDDVFDDFTSEEDCRAAIAQYEKDVLGKGDKLVENSEYIFITMQPQVAMTIMDQSTGEVQAIVGGRGNKAGNRTWNRATKTCRQPGSTFKIIACYAPALDAGGKTLASVQDDAPFTVGNKTYNNYSHTFGGFTSIRKAITKSINIVTVKTLQDIGVDLGYEYAENFGFSTLTDTDRNLGISLGGLTQGVTNLELTAAYAAIANQGEYNEPSFYTQVLDHDGNVLLDKTQTKEQHQVIKEDTAWLLTDAMKDVMTSGTGMRAYFGTGMAQAGKSGTTTLNRDALFAGFTPYYTCVVWGGYDDNSIQSATGYPKNLWKAVMKRIHADLKAKDFEKPSGITQAVVCAKSGLLPEADVCDKDPRGTQSYTEYFAEGTVPTENCDHHISLQICEASGKVAGEYCPADQVVTKTYIVGAEKGSADYQYCATEKFLNGTCNIHDAETQDEEKPEEEPADPPDDAKPEETYEPEQIPEKNEE